VTGGRRLRLVKLVEIVYLLEAGAFLSLAPWSRLWMDRVVSRSPALLHGFLSSAYFRGFIAGLGLLHMLLALRDLSRFRVGSTVGALAPPRTDP
jgi:hypothetical protein